MELTDYQLEVLRLVAGGQKVFTPEGDGGEAALAAFQPKAEEIVELNDFGLLELRSEPHREQRTGHRYIDHIMIQSLTAAGRREIS
jgi:hypothetical protein